MKKDYFRGEVIQITETEDVRHLTNALRIKPGESFYVTDGEGGAFETSVSGVNKKSVTLKITKVFPRLRRQEKKVRVTIACAVPRYAHFEEIVDKATQLGADELIPLLTQRTLVSKEAFDKKRKRYDRILVAAAKQSGALFLPVLKPATDFQALIKVLPRYDLALIPYLAGASVTLSDALKGFESGSILVLIGPEGDFTGQEIKKALAAGCRGVTLGPSVLRVDTAAIAVLGFLRLMLG
ncbi:MAG: RsmE family RNA methyltransferase [Candidatus Omnitrophota bacterium]